MLGAANIGQCPLCKTKRRTLKVIPHNGVRGAKIPYSFFGGALQAMASMNQPSHRKNGGWNHTCTPVCQMCCASRAHKKQPNMLCPV